MTRLAAIVVLLTLGLVALVYAALEVLNALLGGHPEAACQRCLRANPAWSAPDDLWNAVMGTPDNPRAEGVIVCPSCFAEAAPGAIWRFSPADRL